MRYMIYILIFSFSSLSISANSETKNLNAIEARELCKQEITRQYSQLNEEIKFIRRPASSIRAGKFSFWINSIEQRKDDKESVRYLCEIEKSGGIIALTREPGRWRM